MQKITKNLFTTFYKALVIMLAAHIAFSNSAFASQAEAPHGGIAFTSITITEETILAEPIVDERVEKIEKYFARHNLPMQHHAEDFIKSADKWGLEHWNLVPAIAMIESTGGKFACQTAQNSFLGWGGCKINFDSPESAIDIVTMNLAGHNPNTQRYYAGKDLSGIINTYNPAYMRADYHPLVTGEMKKIANM